MENNVVDRTDHICLSGTELEQQISTKYIVLDVHSPKNAHAVFNNADLSFITCVFVIETPV